MPCRCDGCGHDVLVSFSCEQRGLGPSCDGRRMADEPANSSDRILPSSPVWQWVLSLPVQLRGLAERELVLCGTLEHDG
jgi:hypothetical protein